MPGPAFTNRTTLITKEQARKIRPRRYTMPKRFFDIMQALIGRAVPPHKGTGYLKGPYQKVS